MILCMQVSNNVTKCKFCSYKFGMNTIFIYKNNLIKNIQNIKKKSGRKKLIAVVKANSYGHNTKLISSIIDDKIDAYAVATVKEGVSLRNSTKKDIMLISPVISNDYSKCLKNNLIVPIQNINELSGIVKFNQKNVGLKFQIVVNTGMNRYGIKPRELRNLINILNQQKINVVGVYSHIFSEDKKRINMQKRLFVKSCKVLFNSLDKNNLYVHLSASSTFQNKTKFTNASRVGLSLYGGEGSLQVIKICAKISNIINVQKGDFVGYGKNYRAQKNMLVAVVSLGYADGYSRLNSNKSRVLINDKFYNVVGNICMDAFMVDLKNNNKIKVGDSVVVLGKDKKNEIKINELANIANTIDYEILTNFIGGRFSYKIL